MPAYQARQPTQADNPRSDPKSGGESMERGEAGSVSNQSQAQPKQEKPSQAKPRPVKARQAKDMARDEQGKSVEAQTVVLDVQGACVGQSRAMTTKAQEKQALALVVSEGRPIEVAAQIVGVHPQTIQRILNASGGEVEALQKEMVPRLDKIASLAGENLLRKLEVDGHRMSGSELSIVQGVAIQRRVDLAKLPVKEAPPDWSGLAGWAGSDAGEDDGKGKE